MKSSKVMMELKETMNDISSLFSRSPLRTRLLKVQADILGESVKKMQRILDVRWAASSCRALENILHNFHPLCLYLQDAQKDKSFDVKFRERAKLLHEKLTSFSTVAQCCLLLDCLSQLSLVSTHLQKVDSNIFTAWPLMESVRDQIADYRENDGETLKKFRKEIEETNGFYKNVKILGSTSVNQEHLKIVRENFVSVLVTSFNMRMNSSKALLANATYLNEDSWLKKNERPINYGYSAMIQLASMFRLDSHDLVTEWNLWKKGVLPTPKGVISSLKNKICICPVSSAEAERGFSAMNLIWSDLRNSLYTDSVNSLLTVYLNGPPVVYFDASRYLMGWLMSGHRTATEQKRNTDEIYNEREKNRIMIFG